MTAKERPSLPGGVWQRQRAGLSEQPQSGGGRGLGAAPARTFLQGRAHSLILAASWQPFRHWAFPVTAFQGTRRAAGPCLGYVVSWALQGPKEVPDFSREDVNVRGSQHPGPQDDTPRP